MPESEIKSLLRIADVKKMTGLPISTLYLLMKQGSFPKNHKIGYRSVAWLQADVEAWVHSKTNAERVQK